MSLRPFEQLAYADVPPRPRVPHPWFSLTARSVRVHTDWFGSFAMRYRVTGSGPPLVLVHGLMTTGYSWRYTVAQLASEFTVYIPDLVGCGESDKPARRYPPEAVAETVFLLASPHRLPLTTGQSLPVDAGLTEAFLR